MANNNPYVTDYAYDILNLITVIILIFFFHYQRYRNRLFYKDYDKLTVTANDFSITVRNIPILKDEDMGLKVLLYIYYKII